MNKNVDIVPNCIRLRTTQYSINQNDSIRDNNLSNMMFHFHINFDQSSMCLPDFPATFRPPTQV